MQGLKPVRTMLAFMENSYLVVNLPIVTRPAVWGLDRFRVADPGCSVVAVLAKECGESERTPSGGRVVPLRGDNFYKRPSGRAVGLEMDVGSQCHKKMGGNFFKDLAWDPFRKGMMHYMVLKRDSLIPGIGGRPGSLPADGIGDVCDLQLHLSVRREPL